MTIGDLASLLVALAPTGSLIDVSRQLKVSRQQVKRQFLLMGADNIKAINTLLFAP